MDNNNFGVQPDANNSSVPANSQDNQFAPPPNNIFIRTMNSDMETLKDNGGSLPSFNSPNTSFTQTPTPEVAPITPISNNPIPEEINNPFANQPTNPSPIVPSFDNQVDGNIPVEVPEEPKKKKTPAILLVVLGILMLAAGGFAVYKFVWPKFIKPKTPVAINNNFKCGCDANNQPTCTATGTGAACLNAGDCQCEQPTTTSTTIPFTPFIDIPSSANNPLAITPISLDFTNKSLAATILGMIKAEVNKATPVNTLKPIRIDYKGQYLTSKEMSAVLFKNLPPDVSNYMTDKYTVYAYYGNLGASLGFITETNSPDSIKAAMTAWEKKGMLDSVANLFLKPVIKPTTIAFKDRLLPIGGTARYIAYKTKNTELNYIIYNNYLIITTGKDNLEAIINNLAAH
jgi:hypothetical protein